MSSLARLKSTDSLSQWAEKTNQIATSLETFIQTGGSFTSSLAQQSDLIIYNGASWINRQLMGPIVIDTNAGGATGILKFKIEDSFISDRQELTSIDTSNDFLLVYDNSESSLSKIKKIKPSNITTIVAVGGSNTQIQFNDGGSFAGATGITYNKTTNTLSISGNVNVDTNLFVIDTENNRIGINKSNPSVTLDVVGNCTITGALNVTGSLVGTLTTAAQTNITSLGSLTALTVLGVSTLSGGIQTTAIQCSSGIVVLSGGLSVVGGILGTISTPSQTGITGLGTITTGTWNAGIILGKYGGTGINNDGKTITLGGNLTTSHDLIFTTSGSTNITLPTSGTVATISVTTLPSLTSIGTLNGLNVSGVVYVNGRMEQNIVSVSALDIDCAQGNYFTKTISSNSTFTFSNVPSSRAYYFTLELTWGASVTSVTWPTSVRWANSIAPTLRASKTHLFMFVTDDGGTIWRGSCLANYATS